MEKVIVINTVSVVVSVEPREDGDFDTSIWLYDCPDHDVEDICEKNKVANKLVQQTINEIINNLEA